MKILVGEISQECNTFSPLRSTMADLGKQQQVYLGQELPVSGSTKITAALAVAAAEGIECVPVIGVSLQSSGAFAADEFMKLKALLLEQTSKALKASGPVDGIYFSMHGAMVAESCDDVEADLIRLIRREAGEKLPLTVALDPHAHITRDLVAAVDDMVAYRTYPHIDQREAAEAAMRSLIAMMRGQKRPHLAFQKIPMIVPPENSQSKSGPYRDILDAAEAGVRRGDALHTSIFPLQPWLDVEELGFSIVVSGDDTERAEREAERLAELSWNKRHEFSVRLETIEHVVDMARFRDKGSGPIVASFSADSPGAGSCADGNFVLKKLLQLNAHDDLACLLDIADAPAVAASLEAGIGNEIEVLVGHSLSRVHGQPLAVCGRVTHLFAGEFYATESRATSSRKVSMGKAAVLEIGNLSLLIHEYPVYCISPSLYRAVGLEPRFSDITVVRSATQFRDEYEPFASAICILDAPGFSTPDLKSLKFEKIERPFFPFDDGFDWKNHPHRVPH